MSTQRARGNEIWTFVGLLVLSVAAWKEGTHFFWWDEWLLLDNFRFPGTTFFLQPQGGHFAPLFKIFYAFELRLFGANAILFHYVSLVLFAVNAFVLYHCIRLLTGERAIALILAGFFVVHPVNFVAVLWSHQSCLLLQMAAQGLFVLALLKDLRRAGGQALIILWLQNFFFGNGLFLPLLGVASALLWQRGARRRNEAIAFGATWILFIGIQLAVGSAFPSSGNGAGESLVRLAREPGVILLSFITTASRALLFFEKYFGTVSVAVGAAVLALVGIAFRSRRYRRRLCFCAVWSGTVSVAVPIARGSGLLHWPFYTTIALPAFLSLAAVAAVALLGGRRLARVFALAPAPIAVGLLGLLALDQHMVSIFEGRNIGNRRALCSYLDRGVPYAPPDEPMFRDGGYSGEHIASVFEYWRNAAAPGSSKEPCGRP